ncbi:MULTISPECIES: secretin N-terminal domain-containing protein [unclassified Vibrio]|uniref:secretin N-terminal domain-containing protein n=1 Tax=unclassified Vibrio TaxID=2614977 RepID=UPI00255718CB|nr:MULTISPECIES: secretin N-terminal domain-containing protein [unclassified Vibrio]MDK9775101.1 secretin [Vibrio sp. D401a]MDK9807767.1 secretin [Vibrio sp. D406a]
MNGLLMMERRHKKALMAVAISSLMAGCANFAPLPPNVYSQPPSVNDQNSVTVIDADAKKEDQQEGKLNGGYVQVDTSIRSAPLLHASQKSSASENILGLPKEPVSLNADGLPLNHFINLALGDVLGVNYVVDTDLAKKTTPITMRVNQPVEPLRLLGLVEEVLQVNGVALALEDNLIKVIPSSKTNNQTPSLMNQAVKPMLRYGKVAQLVPIYYLSINQASSMANSLLREGNGGTVLVQNHLNSLMVVARQDDIERLEKLLAELDVPAKSSNYMTLIKPTYSTAGDLAKELKAALDAASIPATIGRGTHGVILSQISPEQLLVTSSTKAWLNYAKEWIKRLDIPKPVEGTQGVYAYYMKNTKAADAWQMVEAIFGDGKSKSKQPETPRQDIVASAQEGSSIAGNKGYQPRQRSVQQTMSVVSKDYRVVIDTKRNALIFQGQYAEYQRLVELLKFVDQRPRQVLLQATVAEVKVEDGFTLGTSFNIKSGDITGGTNGIITNAGNLNLTGVFGDVTAEFTAAMDNGKAQILSSPRVIAMDQEPARISIGEQIQVKTGEVSGGGDDSKATITYQYVDVGITLDITPTINQNGLVELSISQEVSSQGVASGDSIPINKRSLQTRMLADSGDTIYMGGLISKDNNNSEKKVPILGDIPVVGNLFKYKSEKQNSTELVLLITPYVINSRDEAQFYTKEFRNVTGWEMVESLPY